MVVLVALLAGCRDKSSEKTSATVGNVAPSETPAGAQFTAWLTAFNAGDRGKLVAYHEKFFPYAVASDDVHDIDRELGLSQGTGGFEVKRLVAPAPTSVIATLKERKSMQFALVTLDVEAAAPHRIAKFDIHPVPTPPEFQSPEQRKARELDPQSRALLGDTPAAKQFAMWLSAFDLGDRDGLVAYHEKFFPYDVASNDVHDVDREYGLSQGTGGFDVKKVERPSPTSIVATMKERNSEQFAQATMDVAAAEPNRVVKFDIHPVPIPESLKPKPWTDEELPVALRAELVKQTADDKFSGAVIVAKNGKPLFAEAFGLADRANKTPNTLDTRFRIGSMNKMFTAVATLQLVQAKKLALTDTLAKVLPAYPNQKLAAKVTIEHLLSHTGGTGDIFGPEFDKHRLELRTLDDYVKLYGARDLAFEPGAKFAYSNYGFLLLGVVSEAVTKQSYFDVVAKNVFAPAGMTATSSPFEDKATEPNRSIGYMKGPNGDWVPNTDTLPIRATSAGGGDSTVKDLLAFANALTSYHLVDAATLKLMTTGRSQMGPNAKYGFGFMESIQDGRRCFGHGGGAPGQNGQLTICDDGYTIVVLVNLDPPAAQRIERLVLEHLPRK